MCLSLPFESQPKHYVYSDYIWSERAREIWTTVVISSVLIISLKVTLSTFFIVHISFLEHLLQNCLLPWVTERENFTMRDWFKKKKNKQHFTFSQVWMLIFFIFYHSQLRTSQNFLLLFTSFLSKISQSHWMLLIIPATLLQHNIVHHVSQWIAICIFFSCQFSCFPL